MAKSLTEILFQYGNKMLWSEPYAPSDLVPAVGWRVVRDEYAYTVERVTLDYDSGGVVVDLE